MTASVLLLAAVTSVGGSGGDRPLFRLGGDPSPGLLVNRTAGARPFDPPDPSRPSVVFVHGLNPVPRAVRFTMAQRLAEAVARRGGPPLNVLAWDWNAATIASMNPRANVEHTVGQGARLAAALRAAGVPPWRVHLIGHSSGCIVAGAAARALRDGLGQPVGQLTLLEPAGFYHDVVFERLAPATAAARVDHYWAPGPSGFSREVGHSGVRNFRVDGRTSYLGTLYPPRSAHWDVVHWYLGTVEDRASRVGFGDSVSSAAGG